MTRLGMIALAVGVSLPLLVHSCHLSGGPIDGRVFDEATGEPVPGAIVVVTWDAEYTKIFAEGSSTCIHVETAESDSAGRFHIGEWALPWRSSDLRAFQVPPRAEAYKAGYTRPATPVQEGQDISVRRFSGTKDDYFTYLSAVVASNSCPFSASTSNLRHLYASIAREAAAIAETPRQQRAVAIFSKSEQELPK